MQRSAVRASDGIPLRSPTAPSRFARERLMIDSSRLDSTSHCFLSLKECLCALVYSVHRLPLPIQCLPHPGTLSIATSTAQQLDTCGRLSTVEYRTSTLRLHATSIINTLLHNTQVVDLQMYGCNFILQLLLLTLYLFIRREPPVHTVQFSAIFSASTVQIQYNIEIL